MQMTMKAHRLGQKRHLKKLKRKHKKYAGPKYSRLEQLVQFFPLLERAGIIEKVEQGMPLPERGKHTILGRDGKASATSFTE